jgi:hypothetical protein
MLNLLVRLVTARIYKDKELNFRLLLWAIQTRNRVPMLHINFVPRANLNLEVWVVLRQQCSYVPLLFSNVELPFDREQTWIWRFESSCNNNAVMFHFCSVIWNCHLIWSKEHVSCRYTEFVHLNSNTVGIFLTIIFVSFLILIFVFNLNSLPSVCQFDIRSWAINILSAVPLRRTGFKGRTEKLISCLSWMRSERLNKIGKGKLFAERY